MPRTPLVYPKIPGSAAAPLARCIAFEKYDGTNLHWVWQRELGWHAFGTRRDRFDLDPAGRDDFAATHEGLEVAPRLFLKELAEPLAGIFRNHPDYAGEEITVFTEFYGPRSFAGAHQPDDDKRLVLFDAQTQDGMVPPAQFVRDFAELPIARVVYRGKLTGKFTTDVREGKYDVAEGVVCKGGERHGEVWMAKIKTNAYQARLQLAFQAGWTNYWE